MMAMVMVVVVAAVVVVVVMVNMMLGSDSYGTTCTPTLHVAADGSKRIIMSSVPPAGTRIRTAVHVYVHVPVEY